MAGLSFNDMEALRDPVIDEIAWTILQALIALAVGLFKVGRIEGAIR
jgi:hypothetical protein